MTTVLRIFTSSVSFYLIPGQMKYVSKNGFDIHAVSGEPIDRLEKVGKEQGVPVHEIPHMVRPISILSDFKAIIETMRLIRKLKPEIVHTQTPKAGMVGMIASWLCRVPVRIHTVGGLRLIEEKGLFRKILDIVETITYACASLVVPNSHELAEYIIDHKYAPPSKIKVLGNGSSNGINLDHYDRTEEVMAEARRIRLEVEGDFTFLFVGRIVRDKGIVELVNAFTRIYKEHPETRLVLVGHQEPELDPLPEKTQQLIRDCDGIIEAGWQDDVRPWFVASDLFTFPSYREGFPNVVMQAGALGIPSFVTDINGSNEIILEGQNGTIIPKQDTDALYQKMLWALDNREELSQMSANCRPLIISRYRQEDVWRATLEMYNSCLDFT